MPKVNIVGIGPGNERCMTREAIQAISQSTCLIGNKRMISPLTPSGKDIYDSSSVKDIQDYLKRYRQEHPEAEVAILVSGDVGFYSLAKSLLKEEQCIGEINLICGISSLQYFCAKLRTSWDDVVTVSLHGREASIIPKVMRNHKVFILTGGENTPADICQLLCTYGFSDVQVYVGENLSYPEEKITIDIALNLSNRSFGSLSTMLIVNDAYIQQKQIVTHGLPDHLFIRGDVPMTKQEIRAVSLSKLQLQPENIVYDIGAGTGSVSVEIALQVSQGKVYGIEKNTEALELIRKNKLRFGAENLVVVPAFAPESLDNLPKPDKVFIGGHGGNLSRILDHVIAKNPDVRIVVNAVTLETLSEAVNYFQQKPQIEVEFVNLMVSKSKKIGVSNLMLAQNPITIITAQQGQVET